MIRDWFELKPIGISGDPIVCEGCMKAPTPEDGKFLVLGSYVNGRLADLKCSECRGHIKDAKTIIDEIHYGHS